MRHCNPKLRWAFSLSGCCAVALVAGSASAQVTGYVPPSSELIPMGTTKGERYGRRVIKNATVVDGRGIPRANRGIPAAGPVDLVIENGVITNVVLADPVNRRPDFQHPTGDRVIDAGGMYATP